MVLEDEVSCVVKNISTFMSLWDVGVGQFFYKGKALIGNSSNRHLFYETAITKRHRELLKLYNMGSKRLAQGWSNFLMNDWIRG